MYGQVHRILLWLVQLTGEALAGNEMLLFLPLMISFA